MNSQRTARGAQPSLPLRIVCWGTSDLSKPRNRILLESLKTQNVEIISIHEDLWGGENDKSQLGSIWQKFHILLRWISIYPSLIHRYLKTPKHDAVFIGYLGQLDILILWPFCMLRGVPIVWDVFISLYDTIVRDRGLYSRRHPIAWFIYCWEWIAIRAASITIIDTNAHAKMLQNIFHVSPAKTAVVYVGVEAEFFPRHAKPIEKGHDVNILFYGQFIPLHGIETIIDAAVLMRNENIHWHLIGKGQEEDKIKSKIDAISADLKLSWISWSPYKKLHQEIAKADICLGIFSNSEKASNVIPNKVFQILSVGRPLITRDSNAIRELIPNTVPGVKLIPHSNAKALASAVRSLSIEELPLPPDTILDKVGQQKIGQSFANILREACAKKLPRADNEIISP